MAERLADVSAQIENVRQLDGVVAAMRGIAAARAQQSRALLAGVDSYAEIVARSIGRALSLLPAPVAPVAQAGGGKIALIVFCAEQGFAGAYSRRVLDAAAPARGDTLFLIGSRGMAIANERGWPVNWSTPMATRVDAVTAVANAIADALYAKIAASAVERAIMVFACTTAHGPTIERQSLLPVDLAGLARPADRSPPCTTLAPAMLIERLAKEYLFARLCRAAMRAFAAENEARMLAMSAAKTNVESKLSELSQLERRLRQEDITNELIELAAGAQRRKEGQV